MSILFFPNLLLPDWVQDALFVLFILIVVPISILFFYARLWFVNNVVPYIPEIMTVLLVYWSYTLGTLPYYCVLFLFICVLDIVTRGFGTDAQYWKQRAELDNDPEGPSKNPHIIAARIIADVLATGRAVTHLDINAVLAHQGIEITAVELNDLVALNTVSYTFPIINPDTVIKTSYPRMSSGKGQWGVYFWINNISNAVYVGSSTVLWERLLHYLKSHSGNIRKILADISTTGIENFTLQVIPFPSHLQELRLLLALEQYYMLSTPVVNNTLLVAGGSPGGMRVAETNRELLRENVYLYQNNTLLFHFLFKKAGPMSAANLMSINLNTINAHIDNNTLLFNKFHITSEPLSNTVTNLLSIEMMQKVVSLARAEDKTTHISGRRASITVKLTDSNGQSITLDSVGKAAKFISEVAGTTVYKNQLLKAKNNKAILHGYTVEY